MLPKDVTDFIYDTLSNEIYEDTVRRFTIDNHIYKVSIMATRDAPYKINISITKRYTVLDGV